MFDPKVILSIEFLRVFLRHSWSLLKHCKVKCVMLYDCYLYITEAIFFLQISRHINQIVVMLLLLSAYRLGVQTHYDTNTII